MFTFLVLVYIVVTLWAILSIFMYGNRPARSIAWLFVVTVIPIFGVIFYILFGINRKRFKFFTLNNLSKRRLYDINNKNKIISDFEHVFDGHKFEKLGKLMFKSSGFPATDGNAVEVIDCGEKTFEHIFKAIENAKAFIHLQYYIIDNGKIVDKLSKLLIQKLDEGVEVRIIYDAIGSYHLNKDTIKELKKNGAKIHPILPIKFNTILSTINYRNHRKLAIIDGQIAFTGGVNITDKYISSKYSELGQWYDLHLKIVGPAVDHLHRIFIKDFYFAGDESLLETSKFLPEHTNESDCLTQVVSGGPDKDYSCILHQYVMMIHSATSSIYIQNPYFIPNKILLEALKMASLRGIEVYVMVPEKNDSKIAKYSMYSNFEELLKAKVKVCIVKDRFFHSKLMIVDKAIASIGSGNFDYRSFEHNYELNILIYDEKIANQLAKDYENQCKSSIHLNYESYKKRSLKEKLLQGMAKIFGPLL